MLTGKADGQSLFMQGKLKMTGSTALYQPHLLVLCPFLTMLLLIADMGLAMKLGQVVANKQPKQAKL
jgi:hypothetical protein